MLRAGSQGILRRVDVVSVGDQDDVIINILGSRTRTLSADRWKTELVVFRYDLRQPILNQLV